jgi:hypothetical protein
MHVQDTVPYRKVRDLLYDACGAGVRWAAFTAARDGARLQLGNMVPSTKPDAKAGLLSDIWYVESIEEPDRQ